MLRLLALSCAVAGFARSLHRADLALSIGASVEQCARSLSQPCLARESCVLAADASRHVLANVRVAISNVGTAPFVLPPPPELPANESAVPDEGIWHFDTCRRRWIAVSLRLELLDAATLAPALGAFGPPHAPIELSDDACDVEPEAPFSANGLSANCSTLLDAGTECQWIDRTFAAAPGEYVIRATLLTPPDSELTRSNNVATTPLSITTARASSCSQSLLVGVIIAFALASLAVLCCCVTQADETPRRNPPRTSRGKRGW